jgi:preprotein translocase subunit Sss1
MNTPPTQDEYTDLMALLIILLIAGIGLIILAIL